jgi:phage tail sheath gpL-like
MPGSSFPLVIAQLKEAGIIDVFKDRNDLLCGQMTAAATASDGEIYRNVQNKTISEIEALFGINSELTNRILLYLQGSERYTNLSVIPKDDAGAGVAATSPFVFGGTSATEDGSYAINIVDKFKYILTVDVVNGDTPTDIGDAVVAKLADYPNIPVTALNSSGTVTFTATNKGKEGNNYGIEYEGSVAGITVTTNPFSGGATNPTLTTIFDVIGDQERYFGIGWPQGWLTEKNILDTFLDGRFNSFNTILDGTGFIGSHDTFANNLALVDLPYNSKEIVFMGNNVVSKATKKGPAVLQPASWTASYFMGVRSKRLTTEAPLSENVVATTQPLDRAGGSALASLPYANTPLSKTPIAPVDEVYSLQEQAELEEKGFSYLITTDTSVLMGPAVTPYKQDAIGNDNNSFHYLNYKDTGSGCREIYFYAVKGKFAQTRLTSGELVPNRTMDNESSIRLLMMKIYTALANNTLVVAGTEAETFFRDSIVIDINYESGAVTVSSKLPIVTQFRKFIYTMQFSFSIEAGTEITL